MPRDTPDSIPDSAFSRFQPTSVTEPGISMPGDADNHDGDGQGADNHNTPNRPQHALNPAAASSPPCRLAALPPPVHHLGNLAILDRPTLALFCSVTCPGRLILQTYDLARALRVAGLTVISGFHTPMERESLDLLLRGTQPLVICPTRALATARNAFAATLADRVLITHAAPGGQTEALAHTLLAQAKPLYTLDSPANATLRTLGAHPLTPTDLHLLTPLDK